MCLGLLWEERGGRGPLEEESSEESAGTGMAGGRVGLGEEAGRSREAISRSDGSKRRRSSKRKVVSERARLW